MKILTYLCGLFIFLFFIPKAKAQEDTLRFLDSEFSIKISHSFYQRNPKTEWHYFTLTGEHPKARATDFNRDVTKNLLISKTTKFKNLDLFAGYTYTRYDGNPSFSNKLPGIQYYEFYEQFNGGGVFLGVKPHITKKYWGLFAEFALGYYSYEETIKFEGTTPSPLYTPIDTSYSNISNGLGGHSVIGGRIHYKKFGLEIGFRTLISGGADASFFLQGMDYGITYRFN